MTIRLLITFVVLSAIAVSAMAQDTAKSKVVQEDPLLTAVQSRDSDEDDALALPSAPENSDDNKVQADPLLRPAVTADASASERKRTDEQATPVPEQNSVSQPRAKVQADPILDSSPPDVPQKSRPREDGETGMPARAEPEASKETRLVPKPKDKAVQEDPLLRTGTPF